MPGSVAWGSLRRSILELITPGEEETREVEGFCRRVEESLTDRLRGAGFRAVAEVHGSAARGTWLSGERDLDVFIVLDEVYDRSVLPGVLDVVKDFVGEDWVEAYAEHPYISAKMGGFDVEFVPCFRVDPREGLVSATDRTPLHTGFVMGRLTREGMAEVRLLKRFMKGVGVYGAEVKVGGFSGYLSELLIIHSGSFEAVLEGAAAWRTGVVVDLLGDSERDYLRKRFREPLIVPDPVDPGRNVASAVSESSLWSFVVAARAFLSEPRRVFFFPEEAVVEAPRLLEDLRSRGSSLLFVVVEDGHTEVPDVLWGQLYKSEKAMVSALEKEGFGVMHSSAWSDESSRHILVFELEAAVLPGVVRRMGPPVEMEESGRQFLRAHLGAEDTVSGPWIEGRRWWVEVRRPQPDARAFVASLLKHGGREIGISRGLAERIVEGHRVLLGDEIGEYLDRGFSGFLDRFLRGRPGWLE